MLFKVHEIVKDKEINIYEINFVEVELKSKHRKKNFYDNKNGWELRILAPLKPIIYHPDAEIGDIIKVEFDPKYTFDTKLGQYKAVGENK